MAATIRDELAETFSLDIAGAIAASFVDTVVRRRHELEAESKAKRMLN
jgi:hypothetical protein